MKPPVVEVVRHRGPRLPAPRDAPLPEPVLDALTSIAGDLRHLPRDCIGDAAELLHWLRRMANRVEGVGRMRVAGSVLPQQVRRPLACRADTPRALTIHEQAEAVFGTAPIAGKSQAVARRPATRTVTNRKGRAVPVEIRRARAAGQMDLWS